ncbi:DinB family protein [Terracoccus sp. 273MFTsu3.1]|uniref:DinB family protein n=1 Tax=Terracoccus sp. 273MFTsu3.1 TaxID=1172188 RepID=UPI000377FC2D|nr:DinB family protein [Terracoccus sp. 273MFTsu3.1]
MPDTHPAPDHDAWLVQTLQSHREAVLWKLDGLSDHDVRRPLTPTGTNLLGLVKHLAYVEFGYLGETFGRPADRPLPAWSEDAEVNDDLYARADESREEVVDLYRAAWRHGEGTIALGLDTMGRVPHWPEERAHVDVRFVLGHLVAETARHAGHADILREQLDGSVGRFRDRDNMPGVDADWWDAYLTRVQAAADAHR